MKKPWLILFSFCLMTSSAWLVAADSLDALYSRFSGTSQFLRGVAYGNGMYVAVGESGVILTSTDGITWIPQLSGVTNRLNGITHGANGFVAVGNSFAGSPGSILVSVDGIQWSKPTSPVTNHLAAVSYGAGRYVAVGSRGMILVSTNGVNWSKISTGAPYDFNAVEAGSAGGATTFILVGDSGTVMTSPDGLAWTLRFSGTFARLAGISIFRHGAGLNVAVGDSGTIITSPDSTTWTVQNSGTDTDLYAVSGDGLGRFGVVGQGGAYLSSPDGNTWSAQSSATTNDLRGMLYANGNFLAVGGSGSIQSGTSWISRDAGTAQPLADVVFAGGSFIAVGGTVAVISTNVIVRSLDGKDWTVVRTGVDGALYGVAYGASGYVAVGDLGLILTSTNGLIWNRQSFTSNANNYYILNKVAYGNGRYVALGVVEAPPFYPKNPVAYSSTNGVNWTGPFPLGGAICGGLTFAQGLFVAVGYNGQISTSSDGQNWTSQNSGLWQQLNAVIYANGVFVAIGNAITTSMDATNWLAVTTGALGAAIAYGDQGFVAPFGVPYNTLANSVDGRDWTSRGMGGPGLGGQFNNGTAASGIAFGNGSYVAVGNGISQSAGGKARAFPLLSVKPGVSGANLSAQAQPGYSFQIQSSSNLVSSGWGELFNFMSTQAVTTFIDAAAVGAPARFYRIISQ